MAAVVVVQAHQIILYSVVAVVVCPAQDYRKYHQAVAEVG